jgi:hypothetical protein
MTIEDGNEALRKTLLVIECVNKTINDVVLQICGDTTDGVLKEDP